MPCRLQRLTGLDEAWAFTKHVAGILVAARVYQGLDDRLMMRGEDHAAGRDGHILNTERDVVSPDRVGMVCQKMLTTRHGAHRAGARHRDAIRKSPGGTVLSHCRGGYEVAALARVERRPAAGIRDAAAGTDTCVRRASSRRPNCGGGAGRARPRSRPTRSLGHKNPTGARMGAPPLSLSLIRAMRQTLAGPGAEFVPGSCDLVAACTGHARTRREGVIAHHGASFSQGNARSVTARQSADGRRTGRRVQDIRRAPHRFCGGRAV